MIQWDKHIQDCFNEVISYSQNINELQTDNLFQTWAKKKSVFWEKMGHQLIYEHPTPIVLEMDNETKEGRRAGFIDWVEQYSDSLSYFLSAQSDGFYENKTMKAHYIDVEDAATFIPAGMKISKAIGKFWKNELSPERINLIQSEMSRIIQENKVSGKLCLSIHPLDYLSLSENQHNWRSCHALDGDYRSGNLSYMLDSCTIIAYIKSEEDTALPRFPESVPWNNKKWRCLFFFDNDRGLVYAGRQYPFFSHTALDLVRSNFFEPFNYFCAPDYQCLYGLKWEHNCVTGECDINGESRFLFTPHIFIDDTCFPLSEIVIDAQHSMHYNDLLHSTVYTPWTLRYGYGYTKMRNFAPLIIGNEIPCLCCGEKIVYNSDVMLCDKCALADDDVEREWILTCDNCGERMLEEDVITEGGMVLCPHCVEDNTVQCEECGTSVLTLIHAVYYDQKRSAQLCSDCYCGHHKKFRGWLSF